MIEEPAAPRRGRGALVQDLAREDLDLYAVEELEERAAALRAEVDRTLAARDRKTSTRSAADAVFSFPPSAE